MCKPISEPMTPVKLDLLFPCVLPLSEVGKNISLLQLFKVLCENLIRRKHCPWPKVIRPTGITFYKGQLQNAVGEFSAYTKDQYIRN